MLTTLNFQYKQDNQTPTSILHLIAKHLNQEWFNHFSDSLLPT